MFKTCTKNCCLNIIFFPNINNQYILSQYHNNSTMFSVRVLQIRETITPQWGTFRARTLPWDSTCKWHLTIKGSLLHNLTNDISKGRQSHLNEAHFTLVLSPETVHAPGPLCVGVLFLTLADVDHHTALEQVQEARRLLALRHTNL